MECIVIASHKVKSDGNIDTIKEPTKAIELQATR